MNVFNLQFALLAIHLRSTLGKFSKGTLNTQDTLSNWEFLDRYCFVSQVGSLRYELLFPATCLEKRAVLNPQNNQIITLTDPFPKQTYKSYIRYGGCVRFVRDKQLWFNCTDERRFLSYRERWWYLVIANCNSTRGVYAEYKVWMANGGQGDFWFHQFSADQFYILPTDIAFALLELFTLVIGITVAFLLRARQMFHHTYKLFLVSLVLEVVSLFCDCVAFGDYAENGVGMPIMNLLGEMSRAGSKLTFLFLLILMGKGYTITRGRLSILSTWKIALFMTTYTLIYGTLFIWQTKAFDPGKVLYLYDSPAGYGILIMRLVGWVWFCYAVYFTLVHYPEKRGFYFRFSICFSVWFWMGPVVIMLSNLILRNWHREKVVNGVENAICFFGFAAFLFITRPSAANINFPYHVRTTQIDILNESDDSEGSINLPHHTYEMGKFPKNDVFTVAGRNRMGNDKEDPFMRAKAREGSPAPTDPLSQARAAEPPPSYEETVNYVIRSPGVSANNTAAPVF